MEADVQDLKKAEISLRLFKGALDRKDAAQLRTMVSRRGPSLIEEIDSLVALLEKCPTPVRKEKGCCLEPN